MQNRPPAPVTAPRRGRCGALNTSAIDPQSRTVPCIRQAGHVEAGDLEHRSILHAWDEQAPRQEGH